MKKIVLVSMSLLLFSCASKPMLQQSEIEGAVKTGETSADVLSRLGLADAYYRLWDNNRVLVYNQTGLYFVHDRLSSFFTLDEPHAVNTVRAASLKPGFKCESVTVMPSILAVPVLQQLKAQGVKIAEKLKPSSCVLGVEAAEAPAQPVLASVQGDQNYNPGFYRELDPEYKSDNLNKARLTKVKGLKAVLKFKNQVIWQAEVISTSNLYDENDQNRALALGLGWVFMRGTPEPVLDAVYMSDVRFAMVAPDAPQNILAYTQEAKNPLRAFAYLGDETGFRAALKAGVDPDGVSTDSNAFCLASRAGFTAAVSDVVKAGADLGLSVRDHRKGRSYISVKDCAGLQSNAEARAEIQRLEKEKPAEPAKPATAAISGDATKAEAAPAKKEDKGIDWNSVWEFLKPQVPAQKSTH